MKKLILIVIAVSLCSCSAPEWEGYFVSVDESVGCAAFDPRVEDISIVKGDILSITANALSVPGLYMNAITSLPLVFMDDSVYDVSGMWRKPEGAQNEQLDINLQLVQNYTEWHAEILWTTNPYSPLYEWVWTRGQDLNTPIKLFKIADDTNWHTFHLAVEYKSNPFRRTIKSISVDNQIIAINLEMGTLDKQWESSFFLLLETTNMYTQCNPAFTFVGRSEWDNILMASR